jgi:Lrp/AsnC family transcriptional regulator, regulator for asnA, asnC and gidA
MYGTSRDPAGAGRLQLRGASMYQPDEIDQQIIRALQRDGRMPNVDIARLVGVTEGTVRKRLERLLDQDVMRIAALPEPAAVGLPIHTMIGLQVDLAALNSVIEHLIKLPALHAIYYVTGDYDLILDALFPDTGSLTRFLTDEMGRLEGVRKSSTTHILRTVKSAGDWEIPRTERAEILVVDDDADFVEFCRMLLEKEGYRVSSCSNGDEALARVRIVKPDLVILDVIMQGVLDGLNTSRLMRGDKDLGKIPILMVSSIMESPYAGMFPTDEHVPVDGFLTKPVNPERLLVEVKRWTSRN